MLQRKKKGERGKRRIIGCDLRLPLSMEEGNRIIGGKNQKI